MPCYNVQIMPVSFSSPYRFSGAYQGCYCAVYVLVGLMLLVDVEQLPGALSLNVFDLYLSITRHQKIMSTSHLHIHVRRALNKVYFVVKLMVLYTCYHLFFNAHRCVLV